jgi:acetyl-CoA acetyltransferase
MFATEAQSTATQRDGENTTCRISYKNAIILSLDGGGVRFVTNGEPIGASGLRQIHELVLQLRGEAGDRQVSGPHQVGYAHLYGSPGTGAVTILNT